jgi:hypothetical protein
VAPNQALEHGCAASPGHSAIPSGVECFPRDVDQSSRQVPTYPRGEVVLWRIAVPLPFQTVVSGVPKRVWSLLYWKWTLKG